MQVTLREVTKDNLVAVLKLRVAESQRGLVATNAVSIAQAHYSDVAWFRAIYVGEIPVGFVMLEDDPANATYDLWRFMIDERHQGKGYGREALRQVIDYVRTRPGAHEIKLGCVPKSGNPAPFYRAFGFEETGLVEDGEVEMRLRLDP